MKTQISMLLACLVSASSLAWAGDSIVKLDKIDTDKDGKISRSEHEACVTRMFSEADTDQDGVLSASEVEAASNEAPHNDHKRDDMGRSQWLGKDKLKSCDADHDGRVTAAECKAVCERMFAKLDTDKDGFVSEAEFDAGHKMKKEMHD